MSDDDDSSVVYVAGDPGSEEGQTTVGVGDTDEEARQDAEDNPDFRFDDEDDDDGGGGGGSSGGSGSSSSSGSQTSSGSSDDDSTVVTVTGDPSKGESVRTVGQGDTVRESEIDAATNQRFDADEGTSVDRIEERLGTDQARKNPDDQESQSTNVVVTGDPSRNETVRTVGQAQTRQGARVQAAANQRFDADEGTQVDAIENRLQTGQGDNTNFEQTQTQTQPSQDRREQAKQDQAREELQPFQTAQRMQLERQGKNNTDNLGNNVKFAGSTGTANNVELQKDGQPEENLSGLFNQGIENTQDVLSLDNNEQAVDVVGEDVEPADAQFTPNNPFESEQTFESTDLGVGEGARETAGTVEDFTGNRQFGESVGTVQAGVTAFGEGIVNFPAALETFAENPSKAASAAVTSVSRTTDRLGQPDNLNTAQDFEKQAQEDALLISAVTAPLGGLGIASTAGRTVGAVDDVAAPNARASGITDNAGIGTAAKRASGIEEAQRMTSRGRDVIQNNLGRPDFRTDPAFQVDEDFGNIPEPETVDTDPTNDINRFFGESFEPETASTREIIKGDTPRTVPQRQEVLDPTGIDDVDPVTLSPRGGTTDITPTQGRLEAFRTRLERAGESDRQTAQFEQQGLLETGENTGLGDLLTNTRKGQQQLITEQKPKDVDTGVETDTQRLVDGDDRRKDISDNQINRRPDETLDQINNRPRTRSRRGTDLENPQTSALRTGLGFVQDSRQDLGIVPEEDQGLTPVSEEDLQQPLDQDKETDGITRGEGGGQQPFNRVFEKEEQLFNRPRDDDFTNTNLPRDPDIDFGQEQTNQEDLSAGFFDEPSTNNEPEASPDLTALVFGGGEENVGGVENPATGLERRAPQTAEQEEDFENDGFLNQF